MEQARDGWLRQGYATKACRHTGLHTLNMQTLHHINYRKFRALSLNGKASNCQLGKNQFESGRARLKKIKLIIKCKFDNSKKRLYYKFKKKSDCIKFIDKYF